MNDLGNIFKISGFTKTRFLRIANELILKNFYIEIRQANFSVIKKSEQTAARSMRGKFTFF